jgi:Aspartyl protease
MYKNTVAGMIIVAVLLPCISLGAAEAKNCQLKRYASLELSEPVGSHLLVPVTIKGTRAYMVLDLASPYSSVLESAASRFALPTQSITTRVEVHVAGKQLQRLATVAPFSLGGLEFKSAEFLVFPDKIFSGGTADAPVIGILGMNFLAQFDIELDVAHRKMNLFSQDHCPGHTVYWSKSYDSAPIRLGTLGEFYFPMDLDGKKLETTLATSNTMTTLHTDASRKLYNFDSHSTDIETEMDATGRTTAHYRAMKLSGEGIEIINARIALVDPVPNSSCYLGSRSGAATYEGCFGVHPLALGQNVIDKLHFYIATKEKMLYFTPADAAE